MELPARNTRPIVLSSFFSAKMRKIFQSYRSKASEADMQTLLKFWGADLVTVPLSLLPVPELHIVQSLNHDGYLLCLRGVTGSF